MAAIEAGVTALDPDEARTAAARTELEVSGAGCITRRCSIIAHGLTDLSCGLGNRSRFERRRRFL
jgi:hypothetical protein